MNTLKLSALTVPPNRVRKDFDFDYIKNLAVDIEKNGLYHPIVVNVTLDTLIAGQNRYLAIMQLAQEGKAFYCNNQKFEPGLIPAIAISALSEDERLEVELNENLLRRDISWQERVKGITRLHELRLKQNPYHSAKETAAEVMGRPARAYEGTTVVNDSVAIAKHLDDPEIASAPTQREAFKRVAKKMQRLVIGELANLADADQHSREEEDQEKSPHRLISGVDCLKVLASNEFYGVFDLIITDPPYGIGANSFGDQAKTAHRYEDDATATYNLLRAFCALTPLVCKPDAHLYMFCAYEWVATLEAWLTEAGWKVWHRPFIWHKGNSGMLPAPDYGPRQTYETFIYARRGDKKVIKMGQQDVLTYIDNSEVEHAAQKPPELYADLISRSCLPGEIILDAFCGRGTVFTAADMCKVKAVGIEVDGEMAALAHGRLHGIKVV